MKSFVQSVMIKPSYLFFREQKAEEIYKVKFEESHYHAEAIMAELGVRSTYY